jgi:hypothetical protein
MPTPDEIREALLKGKEIVTDPEEARRLILAMATSSNRRLEFLYDEKTKTAILQGNLEGLQGLAQTLNGLMYLGGTHAHYDQSSNLTKCDEIALIIQRVEDEEEFGIHGIQR